MVVALALSTGCWRVRAPLASEDAGMVSDAPRSDAFRVDTGPPPGCPAPITTPMPPSCGDASCAPRIRMEPSGPFLVGPDPNAATSTSVSVTVSPFELDVFEVTVARFRHWVDLGSPEPSSDVAYPGGAIDVTPLPVGTFQTFEMMEGCNFTELAGANEQLPMNCVRWEAAQAFCAFDVGGRLPTEAEHEYAARWFQAMGDPDGREFYWGDEGGGFDPCTIANVGQCDDPPVLMDVGSFPPLFCLHDLVGNVAEWLADSFASFGRECWVDGAVDPLCNMGGRRVVSGAAGLDSDHDFLRTSTRASQDPSSVNPAFGFRCARTP